MKVKVTQTLKNYDGSDLYSDPEQKVKLTLRDVLVSAANATAKDEVMTSEDKNKAFQLSQKIFSSKEPDLKIDDMVWLQKRVYKFFKPVVCGRVEAIFEK